MPAPRQMLLTCALLHIWSFTTPFCNLVELCLSFHFEEDNLPYPGLSSGVVGVNC